MKKTYYYQIEISSWKQIIIQDLKLYKYVKIICIT